MICKHCGTNLPDTAKFCRSCGKDPNAEPMAQQTVTQPQPTVQSAQQHQSTTSAFFENANILDYFKNPFKASYQAYNGGRSEFAIFVFIIKCLIFPIAFFVLSDKIISKTDVSFGELLAFSSEEKFSSVQVFMYMLLAIALALVAKWLINFAFAKLFGMGNLTLKSSFNLTWTTSAWSIFTALIAGIIIMRFPVEEIVKDNLDKNEFIHVAIFLAIAEFVFRSVVLYSTYLVANPKNNPYKIALSIVFSEAVYVFCAFIIASTIIPKELFTDVSALVSAVILNTLFHNI